MRIVLDYDEEFGLEMAINDVLKKYNVTNQDRVLCRQEIVDVILEKLDIDKCIEL